MDKSVLIALIGTIGPLVASAVLLLTHMWTRKKNDADAAKGNAEAELVTANTLTVVIDGLRVELDRVTERVDALEADLDEERKARVAAQDSERVTRLALAETEHRFTVLVDHHGQVVTVATEAGVALPHPPPLLAPYLAPRQ